VVGGQIVLADPPEGLTQRALDRVSLGRAAHLAAD
jgi:hypothetical protein